MEELSIQFLEKYKQLDTLCKDVFSTKEGGSVYIAEMEKVDYRFRRYVYDWDNIYNGLKHLRWVRNKLAHEEGAFNSDICSKSDLKWLDDFYNCMLKTTDPLAIVGEAQRNIQEKQNNYIKSYSRTDTNVIQPKGNKKENSISLWGKIKAKFKKLFL